MPDEQNIPTIVAGDHVRRRDGSGLANGDAIGTVARVFRPCYDCCDGDYFVTIEGVPPATFPASILYKVKIRQD